MWSAVAFCPPSFARRRLLAAVEQLDEMDPSGRAPGHQRVRSTSLLLPRAIPFQQGAHEALIAEPGQDFVSI